MDDALLVEKVLKKDKKAGETLFLKYDQKVYSYFYHHISNKDDAKDLLQSTFLTAFSKLSNLREADKFKYWLFKIAQNTLFNYYVKKKEVIDFTSVEKFIGKTMDDPILLDELKSDVISALKFLSKQQKYVIEKRIFLEQKFSEIALELNISENNAKVTYHQGLKKLKNNLGGYYG